jgi:outer membrane immunogenic protein
MLHRVLVAGLSTCLLTLPFITSQPANAQDFPLAKPARVTYERFYGLFTDLLSREPSPFCRTADTDLEIKKWLNDANNLTAAVKESEFSFTLKNRLSRELERTRFAIEAENDLLKNLPPCAPTPSSSSTSTNYDWARLGRWLGKRPVLYNRGYNWTGFYVGGEFGANWTGGYWTTTDLITLGGRDALIDALKDLRASDIAEDVYFGYLYDFGAPKWLAGLAADFAYYNALMDPGIPGTGGLAGNKASDSVTVRAKWSLALRARLGYLVTPTTQLYVAGGPSWLKMDAAVNCTGPGVCGSNGIPAFSQTNSTTKAGWTLGGGVESVLWDNWRGHVEYRYADYGKFSTSFGTPAQLALAADIKVHTQSLMFGLSYGFGGR